MLWKKVNGNSIISSAVRSFSFSISSHVFNILAHYDAHKKWVLFMVYENPIWYFVGLHTVICV